jgi:hypothetical protein
MKEIPSKNIFPPVFIVSAVFSLVSAVSFFLVHKFAVNVLFWDEWDYYKPYFTGQNLWRQYISQHDAHYLGLGGIVIGLLNRLTAWDSRVVAYVTLFIVFAAVLLALALQLKLAGELSWADAIIPLSLLTLTQMETFVTMPLIVEAGVPMFLVFLYCWCWTTHSHSKTGMMLLIQFLLCFTGYGYVFLPAIGWVLLLNLFSRERGLSPLHTTLLLAGIVVSFIMFSHYLDYSALHNSLEDKPIFARYVHYLWLLGATLFGFGADKWGVIAGTCYIAALIWAFAQAIRSGLKKMEAHAAIVAILTGGILVYIALNTAARAMHFGVMSRYMTFLAIGCVGIYLQLRREKASRYWIGSVLLIILVLNGSVPALIHSSETSWAIMSRMKVQWTNCYRQTLDLKQCTQQYPPGVYPIPEATDLSAKLLFLQKNELNLFKKTTAAASPK